MAKKYINFVLSGIILACISCTNNKTSQESDQVNYSHSSHKVKNNEYVDVVNDDLHTPDLTFFSLKGNVKGFKEIFVEADYNGKKFIPKKKDLVFGNELDETFDIKGNWICPKDRIVTRDPKGQIVSINPNDPEAIRQYNSITWNKGKIVSSIQDYDTYYQYAYNKDGWLTTELEYREGESPFRHEFKYSYSTYDEHGNWTKRCEKMVSSPNDVSYWITYRKIYYFTTK